MENREGEKSATVIVPAIVKAISIIRYINDSYPRKPSLADICKNIDITRSHCYNILQTFKELNWINYDKQTKLYGISMEIYKDLSSLLVDQHEVSEIRPVLSELTRSTGMPCVLSQRLQDGTFFLFDKFNPNKAAEVSLPIGYRYPHDSPAQLRAYLAFQPGDVIEKWLRDWKPTRYTDKTIVSVPELEEELRMTAQRGYSVSLGEFTEGLNAIGMPIFNARGEVIFVFNCSWMTLLSNKRTEEIIAGMTEARDRIHKLIAAVSPI